MYATDEVFPSSGLCKELYSLLPLGIEIPKRREQGRVANESN
jgi:hypothetical protein